MYAPNTRTQAEPVQPAIAIRRRSAIRKTVIENAPQISVRKVATFPQQLQLQGNTKSPMIGDFPTPRAAPERQAVVVRASPSMSISDSESDESSLWSKPSAKGESDDLYDISESEPEEIPIKLSSSIKKRIQTREGKQRFPSLVIPSPGLWPTIDKLKSAAALSPPLQMTLSPSLLQRLQQHTLHLPTSSATPSLDGSLTSEELAGTSCPSTPDIADAAVDENAWEPPVQLDPSAINLLQHLHPEEQPETVETVLEIPMDAVAEMREIVESPGIAGLFRIETTNVVTSDSDEPFSALSVPSPGGFFASLDDAVARTAWKADGPTPDTCTAKGFYDLPFRRASPPPLPTSTATSFYNVPWQQRPENPVEHLVNVPSQDSQDPITARKILFSPIEAIVEVDEIDENYDDKKHTGDHLDRTKNWLFAQDAYMQKICEEDEVLADYEMLQDAVPSTPDLATAEESSPTSAIDSTPGKKSVRFNAEVVARAEDSPIETQRLSPIHDGTFWQGWKHNARSQRARDVFTHRQARAEAEQVRRVSLHKQHAEQLQGKYQIVDTERPAPERPISSLVPALPEDERSELLAQAGRERQALQQIQSSSWHVAAQKEVHGGKLLTSPVVQSFKARKDVRILDLAGQALCGWAWSVAIEHPKATVYTTVSSDAEAHVAESSLDGPANHVVVASPKLWELPFEDNYFDVVSARSLYAHLKTTWPKGYAVDEWDLTLRECLRVLKPGGYLEYDLLDAELVHPEVASQALGVEFAFNLKTRGYDPVSGKSFLPRLKRAGFRDIKRAWMLYPVGDVTPRWNDAGKPNGDAATGLRTIAADGAVTVFEAPVTGSTKDVRALTGLVGARLWEQWMLKLGVEMRRSEKSCLHEVAQALEEGGRSNAAWRCLVGWARKDL